MGNPTSQLLALGVVFVLLLFLHSLFFPPEGSLVPVIGSGGESSPGSAKVSVNVIAVPQFEETATLLNKEHDFGVFKTKLIRMGYFNYEGEKVYRADIWIQNVGKAVETFHTEKAFLLSVPNKYNMSVSNLNGKDVGPEEEREGYLLFKDVPLDMKGNVTILIGTSLTYNTIFNSVMQSPHTYVVELS